METSFYVLLLILLIANLCSFIHFQLKIESIEKKYDNQNYEFHELYDELELKVSELSNDIKRPTLDLREPLELTKPIKTNNWDSIRKAFKGPTRVEINE